MASLSLAARHRLQTGRHARALRRSGQVPAIVYGNALQPEPISAEATALLRLWERAGRTQLIDLAVDGGRPRKVLIRELQIDPRTARPLHADFLAVNLREKLIVEVPVVPVGEAPAVSELKVGLLQQVVGTLRIEALPGDLPSHLSVDISGLTEVDQAVRVRDVVLPRGVALAGHVDPDEVVAKVAALRVAAEETAPALEGAAPAPEAEPPAEG
jgi:large subunit ribosomal protein L25